MDLCALRKKQENQPSGNHVKEYLNLLWSICHPLLAVRVIAHTSAASHSETLSVKTPNNAVLGCGPDSLHQTVCEKSGMFQANKATCGSVNLSVDMLGRRQPCSCFKLV